MSSNSPDPDLDSAPDPDTDPDRPTALPEPVGAAASEPGFFAWLRTLRVPRQPGWLGGVCAGVAARLGIDPIIVRGIVVVFALFGSPILLVYGIAWLLLPDAAGRIHLQELLRGVFDSAIVGIAILILLGVVPYGFGVGPFIGGISDGAAWGGPFGFHVGPFFGFLVFAAAVTALIVWLVRRRGVTPTSGYGSTPTDAAGTASATYTAGQPMSAGASAGASAATPADTTDAPASPTAFPAPTPPLEPGRPDVATDADEYTIWKRQHDDWRRDYDAWKRAQADATKAASAQFAAENKAKALAFEAQATEARRIRRLTRPRISFGYFVAVLGAALVSGAIGGILAIGDGAASAYAWPIGLACAALVCGLAMMAAGVARRRSGWLAFLAIVFIVPALLSAAVPSTTGLVLSNFDTTITSSQSILQPVGSTFLTVNQATRDVAGTPRFEVKQGAGSVYVDLFDGARLRVDATSDNGSVVFYTVDTTGDERFDRSVELGAGGATDTWTGSVPDPGSPDAILVVRGGNTDITIVTHEEDAR